VENYTSLTVNNSFTNSGSLYIDSYDNGGSSLTITGTLTNISTVDIGFTGTGVASHVTLGGLVNESGANFDIENYTVATVNGNVSNSGYLYVDAYDNGGSSLTITGTLTNGGTVTIGGLSTEAASHVTLGGLVNDSGASFIVDGVTPNGDQTTLTFTGAGFTANSGFFELYNVAPVTLACVQQ